MLKRTGERIPADDGTGKGLRHHHVYEKKVVTTIIVNKLVLERRKKELEEELAQVNFDLAQIAEDEKLDPPSA